jgi:hypothetical protein
LQQRQHSSTVGYSSSGETWQSALAAAEADGGSSTRQTVVSGAGSVVVMPSLGAFDEQDRDVDRRGRLSTSNGHGEQPGLRGSFEYASASSSSLLSEFPVVQDTVAPSAPHPSARAQGMNQGRSFRAGSIAELAASAGIVPDRAILPPQARARTSVVPTVATSGRAKGKKNRTSLLAQQSKNDMSAKPTTMIPVEQRLAAQRRELAAFMEESAAVCGFSQRMRAM